MGGESVERGAMSARAPSSVATEARHLVCAPYICHAGLGALQYGPFFGRCRSHGISFDLKRRVGTAFLLMDSLASGVLGTLCVGHTPIAALQNCARTLRFIESEVGARPPEDQFAEERSNFADIHQTVRAMLRAAGLPPTGEATALTKRG